MPTEEGKKEVSGSQKFGKHGKVWTQEAQVKGHKKSQGMVSSCVLPLFLLTCGPCPTAPPPQTRENEPILTVLALAFLCRGGQRADGWLAAWAVSKT